MATSSGTDAHEESTTYQPIVQSDKPLSADRWLVDARRTAEAIANSAQVLGACRDGTTGQDCARAAMLDALLALEKMHQAMAEAHQQAVGARLAGSAEERRAEDAEGMLFNLGYSYTEQGGWVLTSPIHREEARRTRDAVQALRAAGYSWAREAGQWLPGPVTPEQHKNLTASRALEGLGWSWDAAQGWKSPPGCTPEPAGERAYYQTAAARLKLIGWRWHAENKDWFMGELAKREKDCADAAMAQLQSLGWRWTQSTGWAAGLGPAA